MSITTQSGQNFSGTVTQSVVIHGDNARNEISISNATIDAQGNVSGAFTGQIFLNNVFDSSSQGTFTGRLSGNTLSIDFSARDTSGDTCRTSGSFSATR